LVFTSAPVVDVPENQIEAYTAEAQSTDASGAAPIYSIRYTSGRRKPDSERFRVNGITGSITFKNPPDFEAPADANKDNIYEIDVIASPLVPGESPAGSGILVSGGAPVTLAVSIRVTNQEDEEEDEKDATEDVTDDLVVATDGGVEVVDIERGVGSGLIIAAGGASLIAAIVLATDEDDPVSP